MGILVPNGNEHHIKCDLPSMEKTINWQNPIQTKTADIEQSLVLGAHGPRSLTVFVL